MTKSSGKKTPKKGKTISNKKSKEISVVLKVQLSDWSETLTFEEIDDTLHVIDLYFNGKDKNVFTPEGRKDIEEWLTRNDFKKFAQARATALVVQERLEENLAYAQEIIGTPYKIPMSH